MSRKNRNFKMTRAVPMSQQAGPIHYELVSNTSQGGTMTGPMPPAEVNPQAMETISQSETVPVTSPSEMKSESLLDKLVFWKKKTRDISTFNIIGTQCCGLHSLSGFQYKKEWDPIEVILGVQKTYKKNLASALKVSEANVAAERAIYALPEGQQIGQPQYPYPNHIAGPKHIAGMLLFTWNHEMYHESAKKVAKFIEENSLGKCTFTEPAYNPNSHNTIRAMVWSVDRHGYAAFIEKAGVTFD